MSRILSIPMTDAEAATLHECVQHKIDWSNQEIETTFRGDYKNELILAVPKLEKLRDKLSAALRA